MEAELEILITKIDNEGIHYTLDNWDWDELQDSELVMLINKYHELPPIISRIEKRIEELMDEQGSS